MSLTQHPLSAAFPAMPVAEFDELCADIKFNGLREPITLFEGQVIDGWHRYRACVLAKVHPASRLLPEGTDPVAFVESVNLHRRHLTGSQRAMAIVETRSWRKAGRPEIKPEPGSGLASKEAAMAKAADVSDRTIRHAKAVDDKATPEVKAAVKAGKVSVKTAAKVANRPKAQQAKALAEATKPKAKPAKKKATLKQVAPPEATDADLPTLRETLVEQEAEIARLTGLVNAADANDQKAEALKWRRSYDVSVRGQSEAMDRAHKSVEREKWTARQLARCGKAVGVDDPTKIAAAVEAMARSVKVAA